MQEPFDLALDTEGRAQVAFNVEADKAPSGTFVEEIVDLLVAAVVGTYGSNIFATAKAIIPVGDGPFLSIIETGGSPPGYIHNLATPAYQYPSAQVLVRASTYAAARTMARAAYNALASVANTTITI